MAADNYAYMRYESLSEADWESILGKFQAFEGAGASTTLAEGRAEDGWMQINAGGANSQGYMTSLRAQIKSEVGPEPMEFETSVPMGNSRVRTSGDAS